MTPLRLRQDRLQWVELENEVIALDEEALAYLSANESAALLWRELAAGTTLDALAGRLVEHFDLEPERATADVSRFVDELRTRGLLED